MKKISVIGFGKIGQAVVANILKHGIEVTAVDINEELPLLFKQGKYTSSEPGLEQILTAGFATGQLTISNQFQDIVNSEAVIVCIPLLVDKEKNIIAELFLNCFETIAAYLKNEMLLVIETSIPVGFARNKIMDII